MEMKDIVKEFPGVKALNHVNLKIRRGEIHALCGENGAGKSTLMKVLSGVYPYKSYTGQILINGKEQQFHTIGDSERSGVAIIYQELALVKDITVAENVCLGKLDCKCGVVNWNAVYTRTMKILKEMGVDIDINKKVKDLGVGQQQLVEIAKALTLNANILILDEPTAALTEHEVDLLLAILHKLREKGVTCIMISHKLNEVFEIADNITVIRDGQSVATMKTTETCEDEVIRYMVGREMTQRYPAWEGEQKFGKELLRVENMNYVDEFGKSHVKNASFSVKSGEIVGISGLMGAGRTELISSILGFVEGKVTGDVYVDGTKVSIHCPSDAIRNGIAMVSEDRKRYGLIMGQSIGNNITISSLDQVSHMGVLNHAAEHTEATKHAKDLSVKANSCQVNVETLSGGNQQKVLLARCMMTKPKIVFLDEPTRGIDVGAKYEIYVLMQKLAAQGAAIVMVSSEMPEIIGMSDRVLVMCEGELRGEFSHDEVTQEKIMTVASGGKQ